MTFVEGDGPIPCDIAFVGEAPGHKEVEENRPFVEWAPAGKEFARYLRIPRLNRSEIYITNLFKEPIPDKPSAEELKMWGGILTTEIREVEPEVIVTLGRYSTRHFLGDVNITDVSGLAYAGGESVVMPIIHPAAGLHNPEMQPHIVAGFRALKGLLEGEDVFRVVDRIEPRYEEVDAWMTEGKESIVALDTEAASRSWVSACATVGDACVIKTGDVRIDPNSFVILHGALYDYPVLKKLGIAPKRFVCTQIALFLLGTEPIGLKQAAYRFCGMEMQSYAEVTRDASHRLAKNYFDTISEVDWEDPEPILTFERDGTSKIRQPRNLNWLIKKANKAIDDGKDVDLRDRWKGWDDEVKQEPVGVFGDMPVATLDDVDPAIATAYSARDSDATRRLFDPVMERVKATRQSKVLGLDMKIIPMLCRMMEVGMRVDLDHFAKLEDTLTDDLADLNERIQDIAGYPINPGAGDQIAQLLFHELDLKQFKLTRKKKRGAVDNKSLEAIRDAHPVVPLLLEFAEKSKLENTYTRQLPKFVQSDGRIHPNIRLTGTPTGRLTIADPNLLAIPTRTKTGNLIRAGFIAGEGHELASWDLDQIEMRVLADLSGDESMIAVLRDPKRHIHKETCAEFYGMDAKDVSKDSKRYKMIKNVSFGIAYRITAMGLQVQLAQRGFDYDEKQCQEIIDDWYKLRPGVREYQEGMIARAKRDGCVRSRYGRIRYLPGIHSPIPYVREEAERQAVNHPIQTTAQEVIKEAMIAFWKELPGIRSAVGYCEPLLQVHDELMVEQSAKSFWLVNPIMSSCMTRAMKLKVPIRCGGVVGRNWSELK